MSKYKIHNLHIALNSSDETIKRLEDLVAKLHSLQADKETEYMNAII